jgi:hypothetical protein
MIPQQRPGDGKRRQIMISVKIIEHQHEIFGYLKQAVIRFHRDIGEANKRLMEALVKADADRQSSLSSAEKEYEQTKERMIKVFLDARFSKKGIAKERKQYLEMVEPKLRNDLISILQSTTYPARDIPSVEAVRREMMIVSDPKEISKRADSKSLTKLIAFLLLLGSFLCSCISLIAPIRGDSTDLNLTPISLIFLVGIGLWLRQLIQIEQQLNASTENLFKRFRSLYLRQLELIEQQVEASKAEAQRAYSQAIEAANQQLLNSIQQLNSTVSDYITLADQISPPWQSEAWQDWKPGTLTPGVVRLGVFTLQPDQLAVKSATISQSKHLAPGTVVGGEIINPGKAKIPDD